MLETSRLQSFEARCLRLGAINLNTTAFVLPVWQHDGAHDSVLDHVVAGHSVYGSHAAVGRRYHLSDTRKRVVPT